MAPRPLMNEGAPSTVAFRIPETLRKAAEERAAEELLTLSAWMRRTVRDAVSEAENAGGRQ